MRDDVRTAGSAFAVVTLSNGLQVYREPQVRARHLAELHIDQPFYPDERIARLGKTRGFPVLSLAPRMFEEASARGVALHGFANAVPDGGHWNEEGHRVAGTLIGHWLCGLIGSDVSSPGPPAPAGSSSSDGDAIHANVPPINPLGR